jgi:hypothetical protein
MKITVSAIPITSDCSSAITPPASSWSVCGEIPQKLPFAA